MSEALHERQVGASLVGQGLRVGVWPSQARWMGFCLDSNGGGESRKQSWAWAWKWATRARATLAHPADAPPALFTRFIGSTELDGKRAAGGPWRPILGRGLVQCVPVAGRLGSAGGRRCIFHVLTTCGSLRPF